MTIYANRGKAGQHTVFGHFVAAGNRLAEKTDETRKRYETL